MTLSTSTSSCSSTSSRKADLHYAGDGADQTTFCPIPNELRYRLLSNSGGLDAHDCFDTINLISIRASDTFGGAILKTLYVDGLLVYNSLL